MHSKRWITWLAVGFVAAVVVGSGCKKKTAGTGLGEGDIGGLKGLNIGEGGLGTRPDLNATEIAGQFAAVYFDYDSAQVRDSERAKVEAVAAGLKKSTSGGVIVEGHCDERGSAEYNLSLGERRAMAVRAYLQSLGVDAARIQTKSFGKEKPVALGHDEESLGKNRRAEFVLFK